MTLIILKSSFIWSKKEDIILMAQRKLRENKEDNIRNVEIINQLKDIRTQLVAIRKVL